MAEVENDRNIYKVSEAISTDKAEYSTTFPVRLGEGETSTDIQAFKASQTEGNMDVTSGTARTSFITSMPNQMMSKPGNN